MKPKKNHINLQTRLVGGYDIYNVSLFYVQETISDQSLVNFPLFTKFIKMIQKTNINSGNIYKTHQF